MKALGHIYSAAIFIGLVAALVAVGTPRSAFIRLFLLLGAAVVVWRVIPMFIEHGLPLFLRGRPEPEVERIQTRVGVVSWVSIFVVAPAVAQVFFGVDVPVPWGEVLVVAALLAIVWLVARRRSRAPKPPDQEATPRVGAGLFPGVTLIARPIAWALERREAKRLAASERNRPQPRT